MGQHGRDRTGSKATRGQAVLTTERHERRDEPPEQDVGYAPSSGAPWDVHDRPPPGLTEAGPAPIAGSPDTDPREGFDGVNRRVEQENPELWAEQERRVHPWIYL